MQYIKAIDVWTYAKAIEQGQIKLQRGQWIRLGPDGRLSRFESATPHSIRAFHFPTATSQFMAYVKATKRA
jgi:hypothetical protein